MIFDIIPPNETWPFCLDELGSLWKFSYRKMKWEPQMGRKANPDGYCLISWTSEGERKFLRRHLLVWQAHNGPVPDGLVIDHINGIKSDDRIENLRVVTQGDNIRAAREMQGNWTKPKALLPHRKALLLQLPSSADFQALANRWGCCKQHLLSVRYRSHKP